MMQTDAVRSLEALLSLLLLIASDGFRGAVSRLYAQRCPNRVNLPWQNDTVLRVTGPIQRHPKQPEP